jgi:LacI family transcriptional regulator
MTLPDVTSVPRQLNRLKQVPPAVRISDVAAAAGVHPSTVSRALNADTRRMITPETIMRIEQAATMLGYVPNQAAVTLRTRSSHTVGLLASGLGGPLLRGAETVLRSAGYMMIAVAAPTADAAEAAVAGLVGRQTDGIIVATPWPQQDGPTSHIGRVPAVSAIGPAPYSVAPDLRAAAGLAAAHLAELGHRTVACVSALGAPLASGLLVAAARAAGLTVPDQLVAIADGLTVNGGERACGKLVSTGIPFTAVLAGSDLLAAGCCTALKTAGRPCPTAVSVTGAGDLPLSAILPVPLTTVRLPWFEVGAKAAQLLLARLHSPAEPERGILLPAALIPRSSTGPVLVPASRGESRFESALALPEAISRSQAEVVSG